MDLFYYLDYLFFAIYYKFTINFLESIIHYYKINK